MINKKAIFFFDANNWYHNVKKYHNPSEIDIQKLVNFFCKLKSYELIEIRWYASVPSIDDGSDMWIGVDMLNLSVIKNKCDVCVLISGDADFVPVIERMKQKGFEVIIYTYFERKRKSIFSTSNQLLKVASRWVKLKAEDFE